MSGAGKVHIGPPSILSILSFFLSACRMYSSCKSSCNSSCKDVVKTASLRLTLFAYVSIGISFLWCILSHTVKRRWKQNLWLGTSSNQCFSHSISSSFCRGDHRVGWNRQIRLDSDGRFRDCSLVREKQLVQFSEDFKHFYPVGNGP